VLPSVVIGRTTTGVSVWGRKKNPKFRVCYHFDKCPSKARVLKGWFPRMALLEKLESLRDEAY
jgi:hypothetical protein